jgi:membrane-bound lytic murein transglycosylase A
MTTSEPEDKPLRTGITHSSRLYALAVCMAFAASCAPPPEVPVTPIVPQGLRLSRIGFEQLDGWVSGGQASALIAFQRSCARIETMASDTAMRGNGYGGNAGDWRAPCAAAAGVPVDDDVARGFFESEFVPYRVSSGGSQEGLFTGYYEPELRGSRTRHDAYQTPLYGPPSDLISIDLGSFRASLEGEMIRGRIVGNRLVPYRTRAEIVRGEIPDEPLVFIDDPTDAFFLQIQGSGRISMDDGSVVRAAYASQNGHSYTAIGAVLLQRGELTRETVSMQSIRAWLDAHPAEAEELFDQNESYVFFSLQPLDDPSLGASGSQGAPLTAEASIAVDASLHPLGTPVWLETSYPNSAVSYAPFHRLLIAQDTGGAIDGAVRGDIYWGVGARAGEIAGRMRGNGTMTVLVPRGIAQRLGGIYPPGANS